MNSPLLYGGTPKKSIINSENSPINLHDIVLVDIVNHLGLNR
jgi:hypothetical protein